MKSFLASLFIFPVLFNFTMGQVPGPDDCPVGYELIDGWCVRVQRECPGGPTRGYTDLTTNGNLCCPGEQQLVIYDEKKRSGVCCGVDQIYAGIKPDGKCCAKGEILKDGKCVPAPPPSTCQGCPSQPPGACQLKAACGDSANNGLTYGKCYQLLFPTGKQMGRGLTGAPDQYTQDGFIQNIPYKVCSATDACGTGPVKTEDKFYLQDLIGPADGSAATGWVGDSRDGAHMGLTVNPAKAGYFNGKTSCSSCKCVVQLTGMGYACPSVQPGITFWPNIKVTLKLQFLEVPCSGKYSF